MDVLDDFFNVSTYQRFRIFETLLDILKLMENGLHESDDINSLIFNTDMLVELSQGYALSYGIDISEAFAKYRARIHQMLDGRDIEHALNDSYIELFRRLREDAHTAGFTKVTPGKQLTEQEQIAVRKFVNRMNAKFESETGLTSKDISVLRLSWQIRMGCSSVKNTLHKPNESNHVTLYSSAFPASSQYGNSTQMDKHICNGAMHLSIRDTQNILQNDAPYDFPDNEYFTHEDIAGFDPQLGWIVGVFNIMTNTVTTRNGDTYAIVQLPGSSMRRVSQRISTGLGFMRSVLESAPEDDSSLIAAVIKQAEVLNMCPASMEEIQAISKVSTSIEHQIRMLIKEAEQNDEVWPMAICEMLRNSIKQFFINQLISTIHAVWYDKNKDGDINSYALRTNRIIAISNAMVTQSKILLSTNQSNEKLDEKKNLSLTALFPTPSKRFWLDAEFRYLESGAKRFLDRILNQIDGHLSTGS